MTFGYNTGAQRQRQRVLGRVIRFILAIAIVGLVGVYMYQMGLERSGKTIAALDQSVVELTRMNAQLASERRAIEEKLEAISARARELGDRYGRDVPVGPAKELARLVSEKLNAGVEPRRLAFVIDTASRPRDCDNAAVTRRFLLQTPLYSGANRSVSFANNTITVEGEGDSARDNDGNPEAWYDPAMPVKIRFTMIGGEATDVSGKLPLHHSIVADGAEQRFSIVAGERGFVKIVGDRCRFP